MKLMSNWPQVFFWSSSLTVFSQMSDTSDSEPLEISNTTSEQEYKNQSHKSKEIKQQRTITLAKIQKRNRLQKLKNQKPLNTLESSENITKMSANDFDTRANQLINHSIQIQSTTNDSIRSQMGTNTRTIKITTFAPLETPMKRKIKNQRDEKPHLARLKRNKKKLY